MTSAPVGFWAIAEERPDDIAVSDDYGTLTWSEFVARVGLVLGALRTDGLEPGDHLAMVMGNRREFLEVASACLLGGFYFTPVNWHFNAEEAAYVVDNCDAKVLIYDDLYTQTGAGVADQLGTQLRRVVETGASYEDWVTAASPAPLDPRAGAAGGGMLYSSGTTGRPKGVFRPAVVTAEETVAATRPLGPVYGLFPGGRHLVTGPLYHAAPLGFGSAAFQNGNALYLMRQWSAEETLRLVDEVGITNTHMVPTMFRRLLALPDDVRATFDGSTVQGVLHGAAPCPVPVKQAFIDWWGPVVWEYYGATEGGLTAIDSPTWLEHKGSVGRALPAWRVFAVDTASTAGDGVELPAGETGQIYFELIQGGPSFTYWKDTEKTERAHLRPAVFTLGDVGHVDADGFVFLTDRASDMIISGGVNIYPAEVEAVLVMHPAVADAAVFGIPHDDWGEEVKGIVEVRPSATVTAAELIEFCREHLAHYKCPRTIDFEDSLPRHPTGKLYKRLLRDRYWQGSGRLI